MSADPQEENVVRVDEWQAQPKLTDLGNAERLVLAHGDDLRYCHPQSRWLVWDGRRWAADETGEATRRAKATVRDVLAASASIEDDEERKKVAGHALRSQAEARVRAMLALARSEPGIPVLPRELDAKPYLLNLANGTFDLSTMAFELQPHARGDLLTKLVPVAYDEVAECPRWLAFLERVFAGDEQLVDFVQRAVGYSLTGDTVEQVLFVLHGPGANGKTTFIETIRALLGDYGQQTPPETLLERRDTIPNDVARLAGARFVAAVETAEGRTLNETLVKRMTGGDTITARFMRSEWFEFRPVFKTWLATNHKPRVRGTDEAIWRRIRLIPFDVTIPEAERDRELGAKLLDELPGILRWAIAGCERWQVSDLEPPPAVRAATSNYRQEMDVLGAFLDECCLVDPAARVKAGDLFAAYAAWCERGGERGRLTQTAFGRALGERGFEQMKSHGIRWRNGLGLLL